MYENCPVNEHYHVLGYKTMRQVLNHAVYAITQKDLNSDAYVFNEMAPLRSGVASHPLVQQSDVIYLHWVLGGLMSKGDFEDLARTRKPIFCFTHDMWWITGGCHYSFDCEGYKSGCKKCPKHKHFSILTSRQSAWKKNFYGDYPNVLFISPSDWLRKCADSSSAMNQGRCTFIPNIVPDRIFRYTDKAQAKEHFGLPKDKVIIAFGTADNSNVVKGMKYLVDRQRPYDRYPDRVHAYSHESSPSFPSGHTATAFALATSLSVKYPKWYVIAPSALWACSVGVSRMNEGVHYPSDVLAGAAIGAGCAVANIYINRWLNRWLFGD